VIESAAEIRKEQASSANGGSLDFRRKRRLSIGTAGPIRRLFLDF